MMKKKPRLVVAVALANRTARIAWALMSKGGASVGFEGVEDVRRSIEG